LSDTFLSVIPTGPYWQPDRPVGDRTAALMGELWETP
jgi:hypothetical protein